MDAVSTDPEYGSPPIKRISRPDFEAVKDPVFRGLEAAGFMTGSG